MCYPSIALERKQLENLPSGHPILENKNYMILPTIEYENAHLGLLTRSTEYLWRQRWCAIQGPYGGDVHNIGLHSYVQG